MTRITKEDLPKLVQGQTLLHTNRGPCTFVSIDEQDPSGGTIWVRLEDDDEEVMVSTALLEKEETKCASCLVPCTPDELDDGYCVDCFQLEEFS